MFLKAKGTPVVYTYASSSKPSMNITVFTDGGSRGNPGLAACAYFIYNDQQDVLHKEGKFLGQKTNNEAEYQAFIESLVWIHENFKLQKIEKITWKLDSLLVVEQLSRHWKIKEARLALLAQSAWKVMDEMGIPYVIQHVPRALNAAADQLVNETLDSRT